MSTTKKGQVIRFPRLAIGQTWIAKESGTYESSTCKIIKLIDDVVVVEIPSGLKFNTTKPYVIRNFVLVSEQ